ncbi:YppG family protein [Alkalihalobacillus pseudalcaliphilus]|uniref:YppG family protein n=1 Tax=Alkalihalobacillus pseudalcaliphilus TaxID=79884 RepID=UPI00064D890F|nr:YppG family protein [Alkalihalobacillus pseudalcaliphilus]KMK76565.1 hypothetical protein AB990_15465 [Alkalihalobacillus pseudalcaliphilus]
MYQNGYPNNFQPSANTAHPVHHHIPMNHSQMPQPQMYQQPVHSVQMLPTYPTQQPMQSIPIGRRTYQGPNLPPRGFQPGINNRRMQQQRMVNQQPSEPKGLKKLLKKKEAQPANQQNPTLKSPSLLKQAFVGPDGKFDLTQTIQTVEQVTKAMNEVSPIVAQVRSMFQKT